MTPTTQQKARGGIGGFVDAVRRIIAFSRGRSSASGITSEIAAPVNRSSARSKRSVAARKSGVDAKQRRIAEVRKLAARGIDRPEIARRTNLSHDTVAMLLNLAPSHAAESAAPGTFFRAFQWRTTL